MAAVDLFLNNLIMEQSMYAQYFNLPLRCIGEEDKVEVKYKYLRFTQVNVQMGVEKELVLITCSFHALRSDRETPPAQVKRKCLGLLMHRRKHEISL